MDEKNIFSDENIESAYQEMGPVRSAPQRDAASQYRPEPVVSLRVEPYTWYTREDKELIRSRWSSIQAHFVDQPRGSIEQAEALVADAVQ